MSVAEMADEPQHDFAYADFSSNDDNPPMQSFVPSSELFGLQAGMEMLGLPNSHNHDSANPTNPPEPWISFLPRADSHSSVGGGEEGLMFGSTNSWQQQQQQANRMMLVNDDSPLRCLFPMQGSQEHHQQPPSRGLSLSLHNPQEPYQNFPPDPRDGLFFPAMYWLKGSMYLAPAQDLLNEFCSLGGETGSKPKPRKANQLFQEGGSSSSSLSTMDFPQLQKRKAKLLSMVEELDRKYKKYREQMRAVVSSFEAVAGEGAAVAYSTLSSRAMSRHFRSLRDGIVGQIRETKTAMGEKDPAIPGITKGETPRLKMLDQRIRQQKVFQQGGAMESSPWRPQRGLPERSVTVLRAWLFEHFLHPYPSDVDKHILSRQTGLSRSQVSNWFINARVRLWKPMVEEMYLEETKEQDNQSSEGTAEHEDDNNSGRPSQLLQSVQNPNPSVSGDDDQKPPQGRHLHILSDSLSSVVDSGTPRPGGRGHRGWQQPRAPEDFGAVNLDFSSYNRNVGGNGGGVSLTLGLQHHAGVARSLSFSQASSSSQQQSIFFSRDQMEDCQPVQFSIIDGEDAQNLPYRNLMGAQLLHDLAR
ncbi:homeobox protein BEL1-like protein [Iris pallida]|uniref:Homeobox protein BEL1-like protein n=1 Tax=Iris pallida TaxID=29817 RepID=A0AAX6E997_IRIPA|nr:homeobox protein BEL1-like protein [Iris pallida]